MSVMTSATLAKWGNSQGIRIPRDLCDMLGLQIGSVANISVNQARNEVVLAFDRPKQKYQRNRKVSMEELCSNWDGKKAGEEWGGPDVGAEVVE